MNMLFAGPMSVPPYSSPEVIAGIKRSVARVRELSSSLAALLMPSHPIDSDFARVKAERFAAALCAYMLGDIEMEIERAENAPPAPPAPPIPPYLSQYLAQNEPSTENLIRLTEQRNQLKELVDACEAQIRDFDEQGHPSFVLLVTAIRLQMKPLTDQLEDLERQISLMQKRLEERESTSGAE